MSAPRRTVLAVLLVLCAPASASGHGVGQEPQAGWFDARSLFPTVVEAAAQTSAFEGPVARASCGPDSLPETGTQGRVALSERVSGRSAKGYRCNLEQVGQWQGPGATWVSASYRHCAYVGTRFGPQAPGVQVLDVRDPARPRLVGRLRTPGMLGTWETLKVNEQRGLLAAAFAGGPGGSGAGAFEVYDLGDDCTKPRLLSSLDGPGVPRPANLFAHEGGWSPDGRTYWLASGYLGYLSAIDVADPARPKVLGTWQPSTGNHGFGFSPDGRRMYIALQGNLTGVQPLDDVVQPNGVQVLDVAEVQSRRPLPQVRQLGRLQWSDGTAGQHAIPVSYGGRPHIVFVDEMRSGAARIIDVSNERQPRVVSKLKLEIQMPEHAADRATDTPDTDVFGYDAHYCGVDRPTDPTALACGYFVSGVRVFDIRAPDAPREIAYFNPPAQATRSSSDLPGSEHAGTVGTDMRTDWCSSPPRFVGDQLWVTCQDSGFFVLRLANGIYPLPVGQPATLGLPSERRCTSRRRFVIRLPGGLRSARVTVNGRQVKVLRGERLRALVDLRGLPRGVVRVRIAARTRRGRRLVQERVYRTCRPRAATKGR